MPYEPIEPDEDNPNIDVRLYEAENQIIRLQTQVEHLIAALRKNQALGKLDFEAYEAALKSAWARASRQNKHWQR